jgi:hypothetical protein
LDGCEAKVISCFIRLPVGKARQQPLNQEIAKAAEYIAGTSRKLK